MYYNGTRLKCKTFQEYVELYLGPKDGGAPRVYERVSDRWEICVATTEGQFNQVGGRGKRAGLGAMQRESSQRDWGSPGRVPGLHRRLAARVASVALCTTVL